ncbi:MAG: hypothetical protein AAF204_04210 [Pseudomonadota bacterium]
MRGSLLFLLLIPALIALGHDIYLFYVENLNPGVFSLDLLLEKFKFSAVGFIWTTYSADTYKAVVEATAPEVWAYIDPLLTVKAVVAGLLFTGLIIFIFYILKMFGLGPMAGDSYGRSKGSEPTSFRAGSKSKKMNYKRK